MSNQNILLSICIPTFNRSEVLRETLESITSQEAFSQTNDVEIVVSDNASTDDTPQVVGEYVLRFPGKVVLHRQPQNIASANFHTVLTLGRGQYLKLHNDTLVMRKGALQPIVDSIKGLLHLRPVIFMTNGNRIKNDDKPFVSCPNLEAFIENVSYFCTWIGGFGLWREEIALASAFLRDDSMLSQVDVVCKQLAEGRPAVAFFGSYFLSKQDHRATYNWAQVFGKNYLSIMKKYVASGALSEATYADAKKEMLLRHILPAYFNPDNVYDKTNFFDNLSDYRDDDYFHEAIERYLPFLWRLNHPSYQTELRAASHPSLLERVSVGPMSHGGFRLLGKRGGTGRLDIGTMVSLGDEVSFVLDEPMPRDGRFLNYAPPRSHDDIDAAVSIVVGDDAWIGSGALISSGVTIGQGAVVAAGSVVTEAVPPYAKVAGNPARVLGYRFEAEVIDKLGALSLAGWSDTDVSRMDDVLRAAVDRDNVDALLHRLRRDEPEPVAADVPAEAPPESSRVPAVLILDDAGDPQQVERSLSMLAVGAHSALPVIILTTQTGEMPAWTDIRRYIQARQAEFANVVEQLRALPDFEWVSIVKAGQ